MPYTKLMEKPLKNEADEYRWSKETAEAIKSGNFAAIDMDALLDEMESTVSRLERFLHSTVRDILEALLWQKYTDAAKEEIDGLLIPALVRLESMLDLTPSLRELVPNTMTEAYRAARKLVTELYGVTLPDECPFSLQLIMQDPFERLVSERRII